MPRPRILAATDLAAAEAIPIWQEAAALRRFGFMVPVMASREVGRQLSGFAPPERIYPTEEPLPGGIWTGLTAILVVPSQDLLARIALGLQDHTAAALVLQGLWRGLPVYADFSCTACGGVLCANPALKALYCGYRDALTSLGVRRVEPGEYLTALRGAALSGHVPDREPPPSAGRRTVTQADILAYNPQAAEWVLPHGTIITHLARDAARRRGLALRVESAEAPQSGRSTPWNLQK